MMKIKDLSEIRSSTVTHRHMPTVLGCSNKRCGRQKVFTYFHRCNKRQKSTWNLLFFEIKGLMGSFLVGFSQISSLNNNMHFINKFFFPNSTTEQDWEAPENWTFLISHSEALTTASKNKNSQQEIVNATKNIFISYKKIPTVKH